MLGWARVFPIVTTTQATLPAPQNGSHALARVPKYSPWGKVDRVTTIADGIYSVGTASHGGIKLDRRRNASVPACVRAPGGWYEEDCEWCWVALALPNYFKPADVAWAERIAKDTFPERYESLTGRKLAISESRTLRRRAFAESHAGDYVTRSAWGDWHRDVPNGYVAVFARRACDGDARCFLVPACEYVQPQDGSFVVDLDRHPEISEIH